jgi:hypothetical protein
MSSQTEFAYKGPRAQESLGAGAEAQGAGWLLFAGIVMALVGILDIIYGIAAISRSHFFDTNAEYIVSNLRTWGWIAVGLGAVQLLAAFSIWRGGSFGRWFGILVAGLSAIAALMSLNGAPFWSLAVFAIDLLVIYGLAAYGGQHLRV